MRAPKARARKFRASQCTFAEVSLAFMLYSLLKSGNQTIFQNSPGSCTRERMFLRAPLDTLEAPTRERRRREREDLGHSVLFRNNYFLPRFYAV